MTWRINDQCVRTRLRFYRRLFKQRRRHHDVAATNPVAGSRRLVVRIQQVYRAVANADKKGPVVAVGFTASEHSAMHQRDDKVAGIDRVAHSTGIRWRALRAGWKG